MLVTFTPSHKTEDAQYAGKQRRSFLVEFAREVIVRFSDIYVRLVGIVHIHLIRCVVYF